MNIPTITAECWSDDRVYEVSFNAVEWFRQASTDDILALAKCGWRGDYPADEVALYVQHTLPHNSDLSVLFDYCARKHEIGFECSVDENSARHWLKIHRPILEDHLAQIEEG